MLVELSINPLGRGTHLSKDLAEILKIIDESGLPYCLTPSGTCIEGDWEEVMGVVKRCHQQARSASSHVMTTLRMEDEEGATDKINENIEAVERAAGRPLRNVVARPSIKV
ncbi:MAG: MTH1187 family thiamine-binding protein [Acidobacteria bacterium]|nr:MTH1187 family thiamine-binding protein [Acidobacteriota bacterium]